METPKFTNLPGEEIKQPEQEMERPVAFPDSEKFDANGKPRLWRPLPNGVMAFVSNEEYAQENADAADRAS